MTKKILKIVITCILGYPLLCWHCYWRDGRDTTVNREFFILVLVADIITCALMIAYVVWEHYKKQPSKKAGVCHAYILERLEEVSLPYNQQIEGVAEEAFWNLSNKIAEKWQNMDHYIQVLYTSGTIDDEIKDILEKIRDNFARYSINGDRYDPEIWTPRGMETSPFWAEQRSLAKEALQLMSAKDRQKESIIQK